MRIAALQMVSRTEVAANLATAFELIARAARDGAGLVALPEYFCLMGRGDRDKLAIAEAPGEGPIQSMLADAAREHRVWVIGGTLPIRAGDAEHVLNANCVYAPDGRLAARYDKIHLFRYDNGRERYDEGTTIEAVTTPVAFDIPAADAGDAGRALRVGLSVCYDLRFPELYRTLAVTPCDLLSVPAAFTHTTGEAHWELLLRARAVENQCYVIAAAQGGRHENGRRTWGHSLIADPWGQVVALQAEGEGIAAAELDLARLDAVRSQLPALRHRRPLGAVASSVG